MVQQVEESLKFETGIIKLPEGNGTLVVPKGFHYLNKEQSNYVLATLWGNPEDNTILGMLFPINKRVLDDNSWAFTISYDDMGYVEDGDAGSIDYKELLQSSKQDLVEENHSIKAEGYSSIELVGWASKPFYDPTKKVLHWAKEFHFEGDSLNTLNYNLRILGRNGIYLVNAIASMHDLPEVNENVNNVLSSISFDEGYAYNDYVDGDRIASLTVGGLVAGKVLAKTGLIAILVKLWKVIAVAVIGFFGFLFKKIKRNKEETATVATTEEPESPDNRQEMNS